jgi:NhaA family Na+:H+ antiporter
VPLSAVREFIRHEAFGGALLVATAALALIVANSAWAPHYGLLDTVKITIAVGDVFAIDKPILLWINDGLMAIFFLLVGLEIKRELVEGELSSLRRALLPAIAALGGLVAPAAIFVALNWGDAMTLDGWAIPAATDIAFALAVLALLGKRVPFALKIFVLAVAVLDDLGAIVIIAFFYTTQLSLLSLAAAGVGVAALVVFNLRGVGKVAPYILIGVVVWVCVLKSGVHATLAGVAVALTVPMRSADEPDRSPLKELESSLHGSVAYAILPLFAFANAGVSLADLRLADLLQPLTLGIALGLFLGKQIGILGATWLAVRLRLGAIPEGATWHQLYGVALVCGIGFTMSLFIGTLAFGDAKYDAAVRLGVLGGSLLSAALGLLVLHLTLPKAVAADAEP